MDLTSTFGQFQSRSDNYRPVIFYRSQEQREIAEKNRGRLANSGRFTESIVTAIEPAAPFYPAEEYHQDFYKKDVLRYGLSHQRRSEFIEEEWSD